MDAIREVFGEEKIIEKKEVKISGEIPQARLLFIEPSVQMYAFMAGLFSNPTFCASEYKCKVLYGNIDYIATVIFEELASYAPDIVLINDYAMDEDKIIELIKLIKGRKITPEVIVVHGLFERNSIFEIQLKQNGAKRCIQNIMNHEELIAMNQKLIDFVDQRCIEKGLVKK